MNVVEWRPRVAYIHWMDGLLATRRSHAEDGGERTRRLGGANLTFGRALALDLEIVGQELDVTLLGDVFASQKVLRESAKAVGDEARSFKVGARGGGALLIVQFLVGLRLGEQIRGEIGASRGDLEAHGGETGETEGERALGRVRLLRRRRLGRGVDLRANTRSMRSIRQSTRSKTTHALSRARALSHSSCARARALMHSFIHPPGPRTTRVDARVASTRRPFVLSPSLSPPPLRRPIVTSRVVIDRASTPPIDPSTVSRGATTAREGWTTDRATRVRSIGSAPHLHNLRVDGEHVSRQTRSDDDDDDDDARRRRRRTTDRRHDPSTDRVPRANSS